MSDYAAVRGRYGRQTARGTTVWAKDHLCRAALGDLGCAIIGALPSATLLDLIARFTIHKQLHRQRAAGCCMLSAVAVGHESGRVFRIYKFRTIDDTLARTTSQIQHDCLPETDNCVCR